MNHDPHPDRLQELLEAMANESLSPAQDAELQSLLQDSPVAQERYLAFIDLHIGLRTLLCNSEREPLSASASLTGRSDRRRTTRVVAIVSLAILLLVFVSVPWFVRQRATETEVVQEEPVRLLQSAGTEFFGQSVPPVGGAFEYRREYALTSGMMELRFPSGAEVIVESQSVFEIADRDTLIVREGACSVHVPPGAEGFRVETPQAEVVDLGTRFSVSVSEIGETDVQVVEGAADVHSRDDGTDSPALRLTHGQSRRFGSKADGASQPLPFDASQYRRDLPDRVVSYRARADQDGHVDELLNVTVQRGGRNVEYSVGDLIGVTVTHFRAGTNGHNIAVASSDLNARCSVLETDALLNTGLFNPGGAPVPLTRNPDLDTPGMAVQFRRPVVNGPGPDVVFFELQTVINPLNGDAFHVSPIEFAPGLRPHSVRKYDITMLSPEALSLVAFDLRDFMPPPQTLDELLNHPTGQSRPALRFRALAVGIDLSDLGYAANAEVQGLFFQDAQDDGHQVDPVFIAGLPEVNVVEASP